MISIFICVDWFGCYIVTEKSWRIIKIQVKPCFRRIETVTEGYLIPSNQGEIIKKARLSMHITHADMAEFLGIHRTTLTDYEFNKVFIPNDIIARVEEICQLPQYSLFDEYHLFLENCDKIILEYCKKEKISLYAFSKRMKIDRQSVYSWVSKKRKPSCESWLLIKEFMYNQKMP